MNGDWLPRRVFVESNGQANETYMIVRPGRDVGTPVGEHLVTNVFMDSLSTQMYLLGTNISNGADTLHQDSVSH